MRRAPHACLDRILLAQSRRMQLTYSLTQRDFFESFVAHRGRTARSRWSFRLFNTVMILFVIAGIVAIIVGPNSRDIARGLGPFLIFALLYTTLVWVAPWRAARRQFRGQPAAQGARTVLMDGAGVHTRWNGGSSDVEWKNYIKWIEGKNQILIYSSPASWGIIPKRSLDAPQLSELRTILNQNFKSASN